MRDLRKPSTILIAACTSIAGAAYFAQAAFELFGPVAWNWISFALTLFVGLMAFGSGYLVYRDPKADDRRWRLGWLAVGCGAGSMMVGDVTYNLLEYYGYEGTSPSFPDIPYFAAYVFTTTGLVLLARSISNMKASRLAVDGVLLVGSFAAAVWFYALAPLWYKSDTPLVGKIIGTGYEVGDIAIMLGAAVLLIAAIPTGRRLAPFLWLAVASGLMALTDTFWLALEFSDGYFVGGLLDAGWVLAYGCYAIAGVVGHGSKASSASDDRKRKRGSDLWLYGPYLLAFVVAGSSMFKELVQFGSASSTSLVTMGILVGIAMVRQIYVLVDKQREISTLNANLERKIAQRTRLLSDRLNLARSISSTLELPRTLKIAAEHAITVLDADAVRVVALAGRNKIQRQALSRSLDRDLTDAWTDNDAFRVPLKWGEREYGEMIVLAGPNGVSDEFLDEAESIGLEISAAVANGVRYLELEEAARVDSVTGLMNHRGLSERLQSEFESAEASGQDLAVLLLDIANFKAFNDTYGHLAGDDVLRMIGVAVGEVVGDDAHFGRTNGDEFMVVLPGFDSDGATRVAQLIIGAVAELRAQPSTDSEIIPVELNIGVAAYDLDCNGPQELLARADLQLLDAKRRQEAVSAYVGSSRNGEAVEIDVGGFGLMEQLIIAIDNLDSYTRRHSEDVTQYATWIGEELGCSPATMRTIRTAALLHDVGKICVPSSILRKPGRLSDAEYEIMKQHPVAGAMIVQALPGGAEVVPAVRGHHERFDGAGYPDGLVGDQIPFLARLLAVADAFSAMTTSRAYRKGLDWDYALRAIEEGAGGQFDPRMAKAFLRAASRRQPPKLAA